MKFKKGDLVTISSKEVLNHGVPNYDSATYRHRLRNCLNKTHEILGVLLSPEYDWARTNGKTLYSATCDQYRTECSRWYCFELEHVNTYYNINTGKTFREK